MANRQIGSKKWNSVLETGSDTEVPILKIHAILFTMYTDVCEHMGQKMPADLQQQSMAPFLLSLLLRLSVCSCMFNKALGMKIGGANTILKLVQSY